MEGIPQATLALRHSLDENTGSLQKGEYSVPLCEDKVYTPPLAIHSPQVKEGIMMCYVSVTKDKNNNSCWLPLGMKHGLSRLLAKKMS